MHDFQTEMNDKLGDAAVRNGVVVGHPDGFGGHEVCTTDSWITGYSISEPLTSFHPTERGQEVLAGTAELALAGVRPTR